MIAGSINEDFSVAVPAELLWKAIFALDASAMEKAFAGMIDAVEIKGDGGLGSLFIMKYNPAMGKAMVLKSRLAVHDHAELVVSFDEVVEEEGGEVASAQFKSQVVQLKWFPPARAPAWSSSPWSTSASTASRCRRRTRPSSCRATSTSSRRRRRTSSRTPASSPELITSSYFGHS
ncbi:hypothetical protein SETIT_3G338200v2 [Setaria italica]|uniref:Bet v I/Major latex protein domain-containing protein n=1 Tax=Setaria italica TaxID=4555 RepID=K3ZA52_SETIT|nr:hypothetical protein SETIT_3G338200v2 [Setaria italica]